MSPGPSTRFIESTTTLRPNDPALPLGLPFSFSPRIPVPFVVPRLNNPVDAELLMPFSSFAAVCFVVMLEDTELRLALLSFRLVAFVFDPTPTPAFFSPPIEHGVEVEVGERPAVAAYPPNATAGGANGSGGRILVGGGWVLPLAVEDKDDREALLRWLFKLAKL